MKTSNTTGLVLGKFMPPHQGHVSLVEFASHYVDDLTVFVDFLPSQPIPGMLRKQWMAELFPNANVKHSLKEHPQYPEDHPDFWEIWRDSLLEATGGPVDYLFASEDYGVKLAEVIGATFVPVDIARSAIPTSGTEIREDPLANWEYLPRVVRPYFAKRVCVFGPESTGKSTLTENLARYFNTVAVPEYARTHIELRGGELDVTDIPLIARGQMAVEDALAFNANRLLFCDTDLLTTYIWSSWLFESCESWIVDEIDNRSYDLYLLTDVDVPWVPDQVRYLPEERKSFFQRCRDELEKRGRPYHVVSGSWEHRLETAIQAVKSVCFSGGGSR